jgi:hypothetical protein
MKRLEEVKGDSDEKDYDFLDHSSSGDILQSIPLGS